MYSYGSYTDQQLITLLRDGNEMAFTAIYNRYWAGLFRDVMSVVRARDDAEDILQELFESLWKRRAMVEINSSLAGYLHASARYITLHFIERNTARFPRLRLLAERLSTVEMPSIESQIDAKALEGAVGEIVDRLPEKMREVYRLSRSENLSYREISLKLGISEETVKKQVYNALKIIRIGLTDTVSISCLVAFLFSLS
jgi:RNA polymerase sigma-70 factor (ECF subfamily)